MAITIFPRPVEPVTAGGNQRLRVNWGHPLAHRLVGAFASNTAAGNTVNTFVATGIFDVVHGESYLASWNAPASIGNAPVGRSIYGGHYSGSGVAVPAYLRRPFPVSIIWYGWVVGDQTGNWPFFAGVSYGNGGDPWDSYVISRANNQTDIFFGANQGGAGTNVVLTVTNALSSANYKTKPMVLGGTFSPSGIYGYKNGVQIGSNITALSNLSYGATPQLAVDFDVNNAFSPRANISTALILIFSAALTPSEHMALAQNPYAPFTAGLLRGRFLGRGVLDAPFNALLIAP